MTKAKFLSQHAQIAITQFYATWHPGIVLHLVHHFWACNNKILSERIEITAIHFHASWTPSGVYLPKIKV